MFILFASNSSIDRGFIRPYPTVCSPCSTEDRSVIFPPGHFLRASHFIPGVRSEHWLLDGGSSKICPCIEEYVFLSFFLLLTRERIVHSLFCLFSFKMYFPFTYFVSFFEYELRLTCGRNVPPFAFKRVCVCVCVYVCLCVCGKKTVLPW